MVSNILSWLIWLPVAGMVAILLIPRNKEEVIKIVAAVSTGLQLWLAIMLWLNFDSASGSFQFMENVAWIPSFNISYALGVDGLSLPMILLTRLIVALLNLLYCSRYLGSDIDRLRSGYITLCLISASNAGYFFEYPFLRTFLPTCG